MARYREQSARLVAMEADRALSRVRVKLAAATAARLQTLTPLMEDVLLLLFGVRKGAGGRFGGQTAEVRARLTALADDFELELDNHPALISYQLLAETRPADQVRQRGGQSAVVTSAGGRRAAGVHARFPLISSHSV